MSNCTSSRLDRVLEAADAASTANEATVKRSSMRYRRAILTTVASAALLSPTEMAFGQASDDTATSFNQGEEIIVNARRRDERLQDVPVAISAFGAKDLARYATQSVADVAAQTPQLVISSAAQPGGAAINLRGIGSSTSSPSVDQSVSLNIDGIQVSQSNFIQLGTYDLERIEILKGPQALFFGKNSPGGVISLVSADPGSSLEWRARASYDFQNEGKLGEIMISAPLTEKLGVRLSGVYKNQNGWFRNIQALPAGVTASTKTSPNTEEYYGRATIKYGDSSDFFNAKLKIGYGRMDREGSLEGGRQLIACPLGAPAFAIGVPGAALECKMDRYYTEPDFSPGMTALDPRFRDGRPYFENRMFLSSLTANLNLADNLTLTSVTGYLRLKENYAANINEGGVEMVPVISHQTQRQFTEELRLVSSFDSPLNFVIGGFYQEARLNYALGIGLGSAVANALFGINAPLKVEDERFVVKTKAYSVFGQVIWKFAPQWELAGGARYSHEKKSETGERFLPGPTSGNILFIDPTRSFNNVSPEATLSFRPNPDLTVYGAYRQGFTSGGFNTVPLAFGPTVPSDNGYKQSTVRGGEIGVKGTLAQRQIQFDLTAYNYKYKDLQLTVYDPTVLAINVRNAAGARVRGVEASVNVRPDQVPGLSLHSSVAYNQARFTSLPNAQCYVGQTVAQGCSGNSINGVAQTQDLKGTPLERAPNWSMNFGATLDRPIGSEMTLGLTADAFFTDWFFSETTHDPLGISKEAWRFNAGVSLRGRDDAWEIALIGKNLTNVLRPEQSISQSFTGFGTGTNGPSLGGDMLGTLSPPRTVVLQLTLRDGLIR